MKNGSPFCMEFILHSVVQSSNRNKKRFSPVWNRREYWIVAVFRLVSTEKRVKEIPD